MAPPRKQLGSKVCLTCGVTFFQKHYSRGPCQNFEKRKFCSRKCCGASIRVEKNAKQRRKEQVLKAYGGVCCCCGEHRPEFMSLDHVNNDGAEHRRQVGQSNVYAWAVKNGFPDSLRLMCFNCNMGRAFFGVCPHEKERNEISKSI